MGLLFVAGDNRMRVARFLFGASCLVFGLSHFAYADFTGGMIPARLPSRLWLAYLTGAGHFAIVPRLAETLEVLLMSSFVSLVHLPSIVVKPAPSWAPTNRSQWTMLFIASTLAAAVWIVAWSLRGLRWWLSQGGG